MKDYLARFDRMVKELIACEDRIALLNYSQFEPASADAIEKVETGLGFELSEPIKTLFGLSNGLQLRWRYRDAEQKAGGSTLGSEPFDWLMPWDAYLQDTAVINILPLEYIFHSEWKGFVWFGSEKKRPRTFFGVDYDMLVFKKAIKPFDAFDKFYSMAFFVGDRQSDPKVLMGEDHLANFTSSKVTNFESYMEFLLATRGIVAERKKFYADEFNSSANRKDILLTDARYWEGKQIDVRNP